MLKRNTQHDLPFHTSKTKTNSSSISIGSSDYKDDGGANKGSGRLYRRKLHTAYQYLLYMPALGLILYLLGPTVKTYTGTPKGKSVSSALKNHIAKKRAQALAGGGGRGATNAQQKDDDDDFDAAAAAAAASIEGPKYRWADKRQLPPHAFKDQKKYWEKFLIDGEGNHREAFKTRYGHAPLDWEETAELLEEQEEKGPTVNYESWAYEYPPTILEPPRGGPSQYPLLQPMGELLKRWPQDDLEDPPQPIQERLQHFDFQDAEQMEAALKYRELQFPFKVYNVPELTDAKAKWTDDYLTYHFDGPSHFAGLTQRGKEAKEKYGNYPRSSGHAQESNDSFFAFFVAKHWNVDTMGPPPTQDVDFSFAKWAKHARYADAVRLPSNAKHYYWQSGAPSGERQADKSHWTMISQDLPSFSNPEPTFFSFNPSEAKGIQCRFGERGVTAATHYDGGRNMVAMITGAKRYILAPPMECPKLGIVTKKKHPIFRHSLLNFGHINLLESEDPDAKSMPKAERQWLEIARDSLAVDTVLKAGEVLYIPSHWFHYIISLQKSAQCNVRSGRDFEGSPEFGGSANVLSCIGEDA